MKLRKELDAPSKATVPDYANSEPEMRPEG